MYTLQGVSDSYIKNRTKYRVPQILAFADHVVRNSEGTWIPACEYTDTVCVPVENEDFIILSDHGRSSLNFGAERIENRVRTVNGTMRSYWTADKYTLSTSWEELPSRARLDKPLEIDDQGLVAEMSRCLGTVDGGAGGQALLAWYESHQHPFWVLSAYDRVEPDVNEITGLYETPIGYTDARMFYFSDWSYAIEKRQSIYESVSGTSYRIDYDVWSISLSLEEA